MRRCTSCGRNRAARFYTGSRGRVCESCRRSRASSAAHARRIEATYGITAEEYQLLEAIQGGVCAVCKQPRSYRLNVDHDHKVEKELGSRASVRGLLCRRCNKLLRDCRDDIGLLQQLIDYLLNWPAKEVIR